MSDESPYDDEPEMDPAEAGSDEVDPRPDTDSFESGTEGEEDGAEYQPVDNRDDFLDWFDQHFQTVEATGSRELAIWCPEWWLHPEVNARLWALFRAHQAVELSLSLDALSDWWLNHWDRHKAILFDAQTGPFKDCDITQGHLSQRARGRGQPAVPIAPPPAHWQPPAC